MPQLLKTNHPARKRLGFLIKKVGDFFHELSLFLKKRSADCYPYTSINNLDKQIAQILPELLNDQTFFIEVGANDGITQSNTYFLEKIYGAKGMLIEASPSLFEKCYTNRSKQNIFEHCALVASNFDKCYVELLYGDLMTTPMQSIDVIPQEHAKLGVIKPFFKKLLNLSANPVYPFFAPAKALCDLIEMYSVERIDLLSLDVEGNELSVLQGCNLKNQKIRNILIESRNEEQITAYLSQFGYKLIKKLSYHDYLYSIPKQSIHESK